MCFVWISEQTAVFTFCTTEVGSYFYGFLGVPVYPAPHTRLTRNYICNNIYQDFIITTPSSSFSILYGDRFKAFSKTIPPHSAI